MSVQEQSLTLVMMLAPWAVLFLWQMFGLVEAIDGDGVGDGVQCIMKLIKVLM